MTRERANGASEAFLVGVNLPWFQYGCDFGANAWQPDGGVGRADRQVRLEEVFSRLSAIGLRTVRWFVFCDGRCGIELDDRGWPRGPSAHFFRDFDAGLMAASRHGLSLIPVLFDFPWCRRGRSVEGVVVGGRRAWLARPGLRSALLDRLVAPLVRRYGREPVVRRWDLFNEPEWATLGVGTLNPFVALRPRATRSLLRDLGLLVTAEARQGATVGLASPRGMTLLRGIALEELQVHWYDRRAAALYAVDAFHLPVLLGEFPTRGSAHTASEVVAAARSLGYSGALGWSAEAGDRYSDLSALRAAV